MNDIYCHRCRVIHWCDHGSVDWKERAEKAEAECEAKQHGYRDLHAMVPGTGDIWSKVYAVLKRADALEDYAQHTDACSFRDHYPMDPTVCDCGLYDLLSKDTSE